MAADIPADTHAAAGFEPHRRHLYGLAYRMLGSWSDAEDMVQEAWLRWREVDPARIDAPRAFLSRIVTRLCLDHLKSARMRREQYVGPWLPEPLPDAEAYAANAPGEYAGDLSMALMLALERLSPLERAAFLLHDVFDVPFPEIARTLGRGEAACRQLAARARVHVREARPRVRVTEQESMRIAAAFIEASRRGDLEALQRLLAEDAVLHSDGGGKRRAAMRPVRGRDRIARFFAGIARKYPPGMLWAVPAGLNGMPGVVESEGDGSLRATLVDIRDGRVAAVYIVRNPDKLGHLGRFGPAAGGAAQS
ncbi:sigma-70 family RNA polymerase sigma factor [Pigmentiphaga soli]|uniref:Sigma-70 family RNA polymerase sigma factor n=1 Tax=Pigmentiphaga soli TaxID=1007095 RepID=A0ABP8HQG2_9BURK